MKVMAPKTNWTLISTDIRSYKKLYLQLTLLLTVIVTSGIISTKSYAMDALPVIPQKQPPSDFGNAGPYPVREESTDRCTFFYPGILNDIVGYVGWGSGTNQQVRAYNAGLRRFASHGIVVAAANTKQAGDGTEMTHCVNEATSRFPAFHRNIAYIGHSQGGAGAISACARDGYCLGSVPMAPYIYPIGGATPFDQEDIGRQRGEMLLLAGRVDALAPYRTNAEVVYRQSNVPVTYILINGQPHFAGGGDFGKFGSIATAQLLHLFVNRTGAKAYVDSMGNLLGYKLKKR